MKLKTGDKVVISVIALLITIWIAATIQLASYKPTGDVNRDDRISASDLVIMKRHLIGAYDMSATEVRRGDMNCNGRIDQEDIELVITMILHRSGEVQADG